MLCLLPGACICSCAQVENSQVVEPALQKLRSFLHQIDEDPNVDLDGPIKKLRQVRPGLQAPMCHLGAPCNAHPVCPSHNSYSLQTNTLQRLSNCIHLSCLNASVRPIPCTISTLPCTITTLPGPNPARSEPCPVQTLHDYNPVRSKSCTVQTLVCPQAFFKEAYKARMRNKTDGDEGRGSSRGGSRGGQKPDGWLENLCQVRATCLTPR